MRLFADGRSLPVVREKHFLRFFACRCGGFRAVCFCGEAESIFVFMPEIEFTDVV